MSLNIMVKTPKNIFEQQNQDPKMSSLNGPIIALYSENKRYVFLTILHTLNHVPNIISLNTLNQTLICQLQTPLPRPKNDTFNKHLQDPDILYSNPTTK